MPLASPRRHCQLGLSACTARGVRSTAAGGVRPGSVTVAARPTSDVAERVGDPDAVGLARCPVARSCRRSPAADGSTTSCVGLERVDHGRGRGGRAAQHLELQAARCRGPTPPVQPMRTVPGPNGVTRRRELGEALDRVDRRRDRTLGEPHEALLVRCRSRAGTRRPARCSRRWCRRSTPPDSARCTYRRSASATSAAVAPPGRPLNACQMPGVPNAFVSVGDRCLSIAIARWNWQRVGLRVPVEHAPVVRVADRVEHVAGDGDVVVVAATAVDPVEDAGGRVGRERRLRSSPLRRRRENAQPTPKTFSPSVVSELIDAPPPWFWMIVFTGPRPDRAARRRRASPCPSCVACR